MTKNASALKEIRTRLNLSQAQCAAALGVALETFRTWDAGRRSAPEAIVSSASHLRQRGIAAPAARHRPRVCRPPATADGILIDGRGSNDQQRFNGQFGGDALWEIKNGKKTQVLSDVTYNAITTDFCQNLDATSGRESWEHNRRCERAAGADQSSVTRLAVGPHPPHHGRDGV